MPLEMLFSGLQAEIVVYANERGEALAARIEGLVESDQKRIVRLLREFADRGGIQNEEKFKLEQGPIFAFKASRVRLLCFYLPNAARRTIVLTHGFLKTSRRLPGRELAKAERICAEITKRQ
jgi:hypothetical protein